VDKQTFRSPQLMERGLLFIVLVGCCGAYANNIGDRILVDGHTGSHKESMGLYARDGETAFGFDRYVQINSAGMLVPSNDAYYIYRGGDPGRWIITKGEAGISEKQGVLITQEEDRSTPVGTTWLAAEGGGWEVDPRVVVQSVSPEEERGPEEERAPEAAGSNCEEAEKRALAADSRGEALESDLQTLTLRANNLEWRAEVAEKARNKALEELTQAKTNLRSEGSNAGDAAAQKQKYEAVAAQVKSLQAEVAVLGREKQHTVAELERERGQRLLREREQKGGGGGLGAETASFSDLAELVLSLLLAQGLPVSPDASAGLVAVLAFAGAVLAGMLLLALLRKLVAACCCSSSSTKTTAVVRRAGNGTRGGNGKLRSGGSEYSDSGGEESDFEARVASAEEYVTPATGELPARFRSSQAGNDMSAPRPGGIMGYSKDSRVAKRSTVGNKGSRGD